jgi:hypothetical protein
MTFEARLIDGTSNAVILAEGSSLTSAPVALPYVFQSLVLAQGFLSAVERTGVSLFPDMGYHAMRQLFALWHDSYKR